jgi:hypothetical protein
VVLATRKGGLWTLMPMRCALPEGGHRGPEVFEQVRLSSLKGCPWRGELCVAAVWSDPAKGGGEGWRRTRVVAHSHDDSCCPLIIHCTMPPKNGFYQRATWATLTC